ncbi:MDR family MFS transporter [Pseudalkalibacillus caeni]|uniref:MFS transporter n=1 Tax=Exobacillus caeni TaxID=2574798 RepID=A0A5R9F8V9_9BACL|nr:MFS transporter [Pseudalkalibacillus caeni]TLS38048.1 MFS transporter [Pseudalkalibacillus caeni]
MKIRDWDRNLKIRLFGEGLMNVLFWMFFPFMAIYFAKSFGKESAGILLVLSQLLGVFANLIGGYCADRYGRKKMMLFSAFGQGITFILFAYANSPWLDSPVLTFICFSVLGIFGSFYWPASHAMVADIVPEKDRNKVFAVFYTAINISVVIGPILGGIFFFQYRFGLLLFAAFASLLLTWLVSNYIRETAPEKREKSLVKDDEMKWHTFLWNQLRDYRIIAKDKVFLLFIVAGVLIAQTFMQLDLLIAVYMNEMVPKQTVLSIFNWVVEADGKTIFSWIIAENGLLVALLTVAMTTWMNKYKERNVFMMSAFTYAIGILIFGTTQHVWVLFAAMFIFTMAELMAVGIQEGFVSKLAPENMRGQYFAAASLRFTIGRTIAPLAIPLTSLIGFSWTFTVISVLSLAGALCYYLMFYLRGKQPPPASVPSIEAAK